MIHQNTSALLLTALLLTGCAPYKIGSDGSGACNELNSQMIFSGSTSDVRRADIQTAEEPGIQRTYDKHCEK